MPISHYSSGKYGDSSSTNNGGSSSSGYYSGRARDSASERGRDRDKEWNSSSSSRGGREWRRDRERDRSRERDRDKDRARSPSRGSRFNSEYNNSSSSRDRERRQDKYYSSTAPVASSSGGTPGPERVSRFGSGGKYGGYSTGTTTSSASYSTVPTGLIREKDLLQNPGLTNSILHGNQYGSYHFGSHGHFSDLPGYDSFGQGAARSSRHDRDPKDDPKFKAAVDALIMNMKTRGDYDQVRKECFSDIDTKAAFINLHARIKSTVDKYLGLQTFTKDLDKVKTREGMRKKILDTPYFEKGIESVVNQILTPKISSLIRPKIEEEVFKYLKVDKNGEIEDVQRTANHNDQMENHTKHESIETREIMPNSPYIHIDKPKRLLSRLITFNEASQDTSPSPSSQDPYHIAPSAEHSAIITRDSDMSESSSEKSLEIDLDARSEMMDESSGTTRQDESGPVTPPEPETSAYPDTRAPPPPPPPPPITSSIASTVISTNVACSMPSMAIAPPYVAPVAFAGNFAHFGISVLPPTHTIMEHSLSMGSMTHAANIAPPPLPPMPPSNSDLPPPPPSPPRTQIPPPPPPLDDDACSSPPGGSRMLIVNEEEDEPLPPGEEPDSYFSQMRANNKVSPPRSEVKLEMPPPPPPPPEAEPEEVDLASIRLPGEDSETEEVEDEEEETSEEESPMFEKITEVSPPRIVMDSEEEESPMFEKICEVSPPRPVEFQNSAIVQELRKDLLGEEVNVVDTNGNEEGGDGKKEDESQPETPAPSSNLPERRSSNSSSSSECKYLESIPEIDYKVKFYKRIPDS